MVFICKNRCLIIIIVLNQNVQFLSVALNLPQQLLRNHVLILWVLHLLAQRRQVACHAKDWKQVSLERELFASIEIDLIQILLYFWPFRSFSICPVQTQVRRLPHYRCQIENSTPDFILSLFFIITHVALRYIWLLAEILNDIISHDLSQNQLLVRLIFVRLRFWDLQRQFSYSFDVNLRPELRWLVLGLNQVDEGQLFIFLRFLDVWWRCLLCMFWST